MNAIGPSSSDNESSLDRNLSVLAARLLPPGARLAKQTFLCATGHDEEKSPPARANGGCSARGRAGR